MAPEPSSGNMLVFCSFCWTCCWISLELGTRMGCCPVTGEVPRCWWCLGTCPTWCCTRAECATVMGDILLSSCGGLEVDEEAAVVASEPGGGVVPLGGVGGGGLRFCLGGGGGGGAESAASLLRWWWW